MWIANKIVLKIYWSEDYSYSRNILLICAVKYNFWTEWHRIWRNCDPVKIPKNRHIFASQITWVSRKKSSRTSNRLKWKPFTRCIWWKYLYLVNKFYVQKLTLNTTTYPSLVFSVRVYIAMFNGETSARGPNGVLMVTYNYSKKKKNNSCLFPTQHSHLFL